MLGADSRGVTVIMVTLLLFLFLLLLGFVLNISMAYHVRHQLQVAADAAALAGVSKIDDSSDVTQVMARREAQKFSEKNYTLGETVKLDCSFDTFLSNSNDVTVGHWSGSSYQPGMTPINALQTRPRRTGDSPNGSLRLPFNIAGMDTMDINTEAIAALTTEANSPVAFCTNSCSLSSDTLMYWAPYPAELKPEEIAQQGIAWTVFDEESQSTPNKEIAPFFCGKEFDACGLTVYSSNGNVEKMARQFQCAFLNPKYDEKNKTFGASGNVTSWSITVPLFNGCPPGAQPAPYEVVGYARVTVKEVYAANMSIEPYCACEEAAAELGTTPPVSTGSPCVGGTCAARESLSCTTDRDCPVPNAILISDIECITCGGFLSGSSKVKLVR